MGPTAARTVQNIDVDTMPVLMIIMRTRSNTEIFRIVFGNVGVSELLTNLIHAVDIFQVCKILFIEFLFSNSHLYINSVFFLIL